MFSQVECRILLSSKPPSLFDSRKNDENRTLITYPSLGADSNVNDHLKVDHVRQVVSSGHTEARLLVLLNLIQDHLCKELVWRESDHGWPGIEATHGVPGG